MNRTFQYNQQTEPKQCKYKVEEMYPPKSGNWRSGRKLGKAGNLEKFFP